VKLACAVLAVLLALPAAAQEAAPRKKKSQVKNVETKAHQKPSKEQIRRFNELQKKQRP
jgi:hypothetical protein